MKQYLGLISKAGTCHILSPERDMIVSARGSRAASDLASTRALLRLHN